VVLLHAIHRLGATLNLRVSAIHVHHGLSVNADQWATACESICLGIDVPLTLVRVTVDRGSSQGLEAAARAARYAAYSAVAADFLALAQHADDQAETVLHQMLRGTGLRGMAGMGEARQLRDGLKLLRPLLTVTRAEIEAFAVENRLEWIEDESNADTGFTRNFLRHEITPLLAARFPHFRESLARTARHASEADEMLDALAKIDLAWDGRRARADLLDALPLSRQVNALYHWLQWLGPHPFSLPSHAELTEWAQQLFRQSPRDKAHVAGGHDFLIRRTKDQLELLRK
jgi:tRNA(Ile)-lysidine synthase